MTKETVKSALTVDDTLLSRMLSVAEAVPKTVLTAVGAAKGVGRDRWEELKKLVQVPANATKAIEFVATEKFAAVPSKDESFNLLLGHLKSSKKPRNSKIAPTSRVWTAEDKSVSVLAKSKSRGFSLDLADKDARLFGEWISSNLDSLYEAFRKRKTGD